MNAADVLATTYFDTCTIKRHTKAKDISTGITSTVEVVIAENIKCALSKKDNQILNKEIVGIMNYAHELFTMPDVDIREGDIVEVTALGRTDTFTASKPFKYSSHLETYLTLKERV